MEKEILLQNAEQDLETEAKAVEDYREIIANKEWQE